LASALLCGAGAGVDPLTLAHAIALPRVAGRIDHLSIDLQRQRLFVAALGNNTVEVLDLGARAGLRSLPGFHEPQGIGQPLDGDRVAVANGGTGTLVLLDRETLDTVRSVPLGEDADNVRFDSHARRFYVGYGAGALGAIAADGTRAGDVKLPAHPESFQLESNGPRIFVNLPGSRQIAVVDRATMAVRASWPLTASANYPMALDEAGHRLFVGCRHPAVVLAFDTESGRQVASVETVGDTDDLFYDAKRHRLYVIGGEGAVDVIQRDGDRLARAARVATAAGARTGLFVPEQDRLYLAVPRRAGQGAEIRVYTVQ
jgi:DNA-binding beta-propeller fold protein YncE